MENNQKSIGVISNDDIRLFKSSTGIHQIPLAYPNGWFAACFSHEIKREQVINVSFFGQDIVLYRTISGLVQAIEPYCPHLGAHLGHGAKVQGEKIICPFHGLSFNSQGQCLQAIKNINTTPLKLTYRYINECDGIIFVWYHPKNAIPFWEIPTLFQDGFSQRRFKTFKLQGLCQDMTENSADPAHFSYLHGLKEVSTSYFIDQHKITYIMRATVFGLSVDMVMRCYGIGYAVGEASVSRLNLIARTQALGTQVTPLSWVFRMINTIRVNCVARLPNAVGKVIYALLLLYIHHWFVKTVRQDFAIWQNRRFLHNPGLMAEDTNMAAYRSWRKQFYPQEEA